MNRIEVSFTRFEIEKQDEHTLIVHRPKVGAGYEHWFALLFLIGGTIYAGIFARGVLRINWLLLAKDERTWQRWLLESLTDGSTLLVIAFTFGCAAASFGIFKEIVGFDWSLEFNRASQQLRIGWWSRQDISSVSHVMVMPVHRLSQPTVFALGLMMAEGKHIKLGFAFDRPTALTVAKPVGQWLDIPIDAPKPKR